MKLPIVINFKSLAWRHELNKPCHLNKLIISLSPDKQKNEHKNNISFPSGLTYHLNAQRTRWVPIAYVFCLAIRKKLITHPYLEACITEAKHFLRAHIFSSSKLCSYYLRQYTSNSSKLYP